MRIKAICYFITSLRDIETRKTQTIFHCKMAVSFPPAENNLLLSDEKVTEDIGALCPA